MSNKVLLLIDLQIGFKTASDPILIKIVNIEIEKAKNENIPIITLNYHKDGFMIKSIKNNLNGYSKLYLAIKCRDDGGREVRKILENIQIESPEIYICGVNTDCCVSGTIFSLYKYGYKINIISNGCSTFTDDRHSTAIDNFIDWNVFKILHTIHKKPYDYIVITKTFLQNHMNILF